MVLVRGIARRLVLLAFIAAITSSNVAEAGLFDGIINSMLSKVQGVVNEVNEVVAETVKKFSVLSGVFGEGVTRSDLSLPEIVNGAFSRNNGIFIANVSGANMDWKLGDGSEVVGAMTTGGGISVTKSNGKVTITTGHQPKKDEKPKEEKKEKEKKPKKCKKGPEGKKCRREKKKEREEAKKKADEEAAKEKEKNDNSTSVEGSDMDEAFYELLSNWDDFVTSSIWDEQDRQGENPNSTPAEDDTSLETTSRIINGVFFGNGVPAGASFAVKFFYNDEQNFYCSGSLIGYSYVLTAAHCGVVVGDQVRVGGRLLRSGYKATVGEVFTHPEFRTGSLIHDLAIVRLNGLVDKKTLNENGVKAARINKLKKFPQKGFVGVLSGHGSVETDGKGVSDELRTTRQTTYNLGRCKKEITQGELSDHETYLCAGDGKRSSTCVGDSGAGLWHYRVKKSKNGKVRKFYEIYGVVSFGEVTDEALCPRGPPTVFQRTSENHQWIVDVVGKDNMP